jgi:hypothetical protein
MMLKSQVLYSRHSGKNMLGGYHADEEHRGVQKIPQRKG